MPNVYNRRRKNAPDGAVYVGRPTKWGNPYRVPKDPTAADYGAVVLRYQGWLMKHPELVEDVKAELVGKDLVCWCSPLPCHADVLLRLANA